jgi:glycosyltransferase involved in cell wall biosynthesis
MPSVIPSPVLVGPQGPDGVIGLVMIVRNEEERIERCLEAVKSLVSTWTIVDTGSEDRTREIVREVMAGIPGVLHERPWVDFAHNRTEMYALARGTADYLLMLDGDFVVHGELPELTADEYMVEIRRGDFHWRLPLLVKDDREWRYEGVAHAYLNCNGPASVAELEGLWVEDTRSSSPRPEKYVEDAKVLSAALAEDPGNARTVFYLAQSYRDAGNIPAAIQYYRMRAEMNGWDEERWYARFRLGCLLVEHVDFKLGAEELLRAYRERPHRIEPLRALANSANSVADKAPYPANDKLFVWANHYRSEAHA